MASSTESPATPVSTQRATFSATSEGSVANADAKSALTGKSTAAQISSRCPRVRSSEIATSESGSPWEKANPALVVASRDSADPGHPYAVSAAYAERLPEARLISEAEGESPLAWQGGRLSREIASFCAEPAVAERLRQASP